MSDEKQLLEHTTANVKKRSGEYQATETAAGQGQGQARTRWHNAIMAAEHGHLESKA